jgi:ribosomal protein S6--L-glutamate ligase
LTDGPRIGVVGIAGAWSSETLADALEERTGFRLIFSIEDVAFDTERGSVMCGDVDLCKLDGIIVKKIGERYSPDMLDRLEILRFIAASGVTVCSHPDKILELLDRLSCTVTLSANGIPMPPTIVTESVELATDAIERYGAAVLKPLYSTKARGMRLIEWQDRVTVEREVREFREEGNPMLYVQRKLDMPDRDLGVAFLGGEYVGTYARVRGDGAWNTTIYSGGRYEAYEPQAESLEVADRAQKLFGLDFTCVDVAETADGPQVFEVSAFGGFRGLRDALGIEIAPRYADHLLEKLACQA